MPLRVLFVAHSFPRTPDDAAGSFLLLLARALREQDVAVSVVAPSGPGLAAQERFDGVHVRRFRYAPRAWETLAYTGNMADDVKRTVRGKLALAGFLAAEQRAVASAIREASSDLVHAHWWFPNALAAGAPVRRARRPLVITSHGSDLRLVAGGAATALARRAFRPASAVTCVSSWLASIAAPLSPVPPVVAPMPVATERFHAGSERAADELLFAGRLSAQKGPADAIRALAGMRRRATLTMIGDGPLRAELEALASELGVRARVSFRGNVTPRELAEWYRRAAVLVMPSVNEGLGLVAVESLLSETPVVAYRSGGVTDVVRDGAGGRLVAPRDIAALAQGLDELLDDPARSRALGAAGREGMLARFSPAAAARAYADVYRDAVARHGE